MRRASVGSSRHTTKVMCTLMRVLALGDAIILFRMIVVLLVGTHPVFTKIARDDQVDPEKNVCARIAAGVQNIRRVFLGWHAFVRHGA